MQTQILNEKAEKGPLETLKNIAKKNQNMKLSTILGGFQNIKHSFYQQAIFP